MSRMSLDTAIRLSAEVKGSANITRAQQSLQELGKSSQVSARQIDKLYTETQKLSTASNGSVNALKLQKTALEALQRSVDPTSRRFGLLSQDIARVNASLKQVDDTAAGLSLAAALSTSTTAAAAGMVSFGGFTASTQSVAAALSRMGVSGSSASAMLKSLQGDTAATVVMTQKLNLTLNQAFASTPEKVAAQINTMRQALAQLKIGSEDYLKTLTRIGEAEAVNQARANRASVIAANRAYAGPTMTSGYGSNQRLPSLPNTMAADMQRVSELTARVNNLDRATDEYRRSLEELSVVQRRLNAEPAGNRLGVRQAAASAAGVMAMGGGPMSAIGAAGGSLAAAGGAAGLAAAGALALGGALATQSITSARALEEQSRRLRVMTDDSAALQLGVIALVREQGYLASTTEATAAAYDILQAGFANTDDILKIVKASTLGAVAGFTDLVTVSDALTSILNGYNRTAGDAQKIVDQIKTATDDGKISMEAYAQSIGRVVPSAAAAKLPLEQINAAISALTAQGVPVETTFSGINQAIKTILKPTKEAKDLAKSLGLEFNSQALATKGLGRFLADVAQKTGKSSDALSILFSDIDGYKAVVALLNDDLKRFNQFSENQEKALGRSAAAADKAIDPLVRFNNSWKDLTATIGKSFLPTIEAAANSLTAVVRFIQTIPDPIKEIGAAAAAAGLLVFGLSAAVAAFAAALKVLNIAAAITALKGLTVAAVGARVAMIALNAVAMINPWIALAAGIGAATYALATYRSEAQKIGDLAATGDASGLAAARSRMDNKQQEVSLLERERPSLRSSRGGDLARARAELAQLRRDVQAGERAATLPASARNAMNTPVGAVVGGGGGGGKGEKEKKISDAGQNRLELERKAMQDRLQAAKDLLVTEQDRLNILAAEGALEKLIAESRIKQRNTEEEYNNKINEPGVGVEERQTLQMALQKSLQGDSIDLERGIAALREDAIKPMTDITKEYGDRLAYEREYGGLLATGINPELAKQFMEIDRIAQASKISLETQIARLEVMAAELPVDDKLRKSLEDQVKLKRELLGLVPEGAAEAKDDATETARVVTDREKQQEGAEAKAERLKDLYKSIGSTLEEGLIGALQTGIDGLIDGTQRLDESLKEILSGVLRDIANQLLRFAVNTALKATGLPIFADGGVFGGGSITPFANGGVVNEPTMFKFSQGGAMQNGLLGEAGPEAILPLRRGPDGRLGVEASGMAVPFQATPAVAPNDLAVPFMRSGNSSPAAMAAEAARAMASTPLEPIRLQVESQVINRVEYATVAQLREAAEAAALAGRDSAYDGMRNNPSIQRSLGMR
jgi:TP901 family phage tail tape measure protein